MSASNETDAQAVVLAQSLDQLGAAFRDVKAAIDFVEALIRGQPDLTPQDIAEGYRSLVSNLAATTQRVFTGFDPDNPRLVPLVNDFWRGAWSNPDSHITCAEISGDGEYRILGSLGNCADLNIEVLSGIGGYDEGPLDQISSLHARNIQMDFDGCFEIHVGGSSRLGNWMKTAPGATNIFIRQTLLDWRTPPPALLIERLDRKDNLAQPPGPGEVAELLSDVAKRLQSRYRACGAFSDLFHRTLPLNDVLLPTTGKAGLLPSQYSSMSQFQLRPGQALLISTSPVIAAYQSICIGHYRWFEAFDGRYVQGSLTAAQSRVSSDGCYHYVVCTDDPCVANWLDTDGHERGLLMMRWQGLSGPPPDKPRVAVIDVADIRSQLPADEPMVQPHERLAAQRQRRMALFRRFP